MYRLNLGGHSGQGISCRGYTCGHSFRWVTHRSLRYVVDVAEMNDPTINDPQWETESYPNSNPNTNPNDKSKSNPKSYPDPSPNSITYPNTDQIH